MGRAATLDSRIAALAGVQPIITGALNINQAWVRGAPYALTSLPGWAFTRAGGGYGETSAGALTWFNGPRTNLCLQSQTFDNASWVKSRATVTADAIAAPDGTLTADKLTEDTNNGTHRVYQTLSKATSAIRYVVSCCFKKAERSFAQIRCFSTGELAGYGVAINLDTGEVSAPYSTGFTGGAAWAESLGDGWFRLILTFITDTEAAFTTYLLPAQSLTTSSPAYIGDGSSGVYIWGAQCELAQNPANPQPTDYIPTTTATVTVASQPRLVPGRGQLIEGARTNLCLRSQEFDNASWTKTNTTIGADNAAAPDGTITADLLTEGSAGNAAVYKTAAITVASGSTYTTTYFIKRSAVVQWVRLICADTSAVTNGVQAWFDIQNGVTGALGNRGTGWTAISRSIRSLANGWYRIAITYSTGATTQISYTHSATADSGATRASGAAYWLWGAQDELGSFESSHTPTTTTSVTRPADIPLIDISAYSPAITYPLTMYARFERVVDTGGDETFLQVDAGGSNNRCSIRINGTGDTLRALSRDGATAGDSDVAGAVALNVSTRGAGRIAANDLMAARAGALGTLDTSAGMPSSPTTIRLGLDNSGNACFGYLSEFAIIPGAVSDANLQRLAAA